MRANAHFAPLWTRKTNNNTAYTYLGDVCTKLASSLKITFLRYGHENGMKMEIQTNSTEKQRVFAIFDPRKPPTRKLTKRSIFEHRFNSQID